MAFVLWRILASMSCLIMSPFPFRSSFQCFFSLISHFLSDGNVSAVYVRVLIPIADRCFLDLKS